MYIAEFGIILMEMFTICGDVSTGSVPCNAAHSNSYLPFPNVLINITSMLLEHIIESARHGDHVSISIEQIKQEKVW